MVGSVLANRALRRVQIAFAAFNGSEWGVWIAMLVFAYERGGAATAGLVAMAQLIPAGLFAPFAATLADRYPPVRVLTLSYFAQGLALTVTAAALLGGAPPLAAYALAAIAATAVTITRPTQAALLPTLAQTADELTASNVVSGWIESTSVLVAPAVAGVLIEVGGPGAVFAVMAVLVLGGAALVSGVRAPISARATEPESGVIRETMRGFRSLAHDAPSRLLVGVLGAQFVVIGALDVLFVVLAVDVLDLGGSGAAYLNAMFGAGGVVGVIATVALVGRARLAPPLLLGLGAWSAAFVALAVFPSTPTALALLALAGAGRTVLDVAGRTLLQRAAPSEVLGRVFGALEGISMGALALGSILAPAFVGLAGSRWAIACAGGILPLALIGVLSPLRAVDSSATAPVVEIALLRSMPIFAGLGPAALEGLARGLVLHEVAAGTDVIREGDPGDLYYVVAGGELSVSVGATLHRGDGFGELALLADIPRTATVTTLTNVWLYSLRKDEFLAAISGFPANRREADRLLRERLGHAAPDLARS